MKVVGKKLLIVIGAIVVALASWLIHQGLNPLAEYGLSYEKTSGNLELSNTFSSTSAETGQKLLDRKSQVICSTSRTNIGTKISHPTLL